MIKGTSHSAVQSGETPVTVARRELLNCPPLLPDYMRGVDRADQMIGLDVGQGSGEGSHINECAVLNSYVLDS